MTVAIVTGAAGGIGAALTRRLAERGARVIAADIDRGAVESADPARGVTPVALDVADRAAWDDLVGETLAEHGQIDLVALNAGVMTRPKGTPMAGDDPLQWFDRRWDLVRSVNLDGVVNGVAATVPHLATGAAICVTSSTAGLVPQPEDPLYSATKHAVVGLVRSLAPTLATNGVTIGAVCPGGVDTSLVPPDFAEYAHRFLSADDVARAIEHVLGQPLDDTGGVWVALTPDQPIVRHEFAPLG